MRQSYGIDALILAGGRARRLGGADKPMLEIGGRTLLDRVIESCAGADLVTAVGPPRPTRWPVRWIHEDPPGGGPVAGVAAGLSACSYDWVAVFAADLPFLGRETVHRLWTAITDRAASVDGAVLVDEAGREQWLAAIYRRATLADRLERSTTPVRGLPVRRLVEGLRLLRITGAGSTVLDCDTWDDVAAARRIASREPTSPIRPSEHGL
jgi:molybdopterin-guanine dinucleotide biosynthesis protein A